MLHKLSLVTIRRLALCITATNTPVLPLDARPGLFARVRMRAPPPTPLLFGSWVSCREQRGMATQTLFWSRKT